MAKVTTKVVTTAITKTAKKFLNVHREKILVLGLLSLFLISLNWQVSETDSGKVNVSITESGFSPDYIEVVSGTVVTWVNRGKIEHWPATDFHPTHGHYETGERGCIGSSLDSCGGLPPGESFSFKFETMGNWGIHDHSFPGLFMRVDVKEKSFSRPPTRSLVERVWFGLTELADSWGPIKFPEGSLFRSLNMEEQKSLVKKSAQKNPEETWSYLKNTLIVDGKLLANAHQLAHIVGNELFRKSGLYGIKHCDESFTYGCFHGVTERMFLINGGLNFPEMERTCLTIYPPNENDFATECIHGIGHGIFTLMASQTEKSLSECEKFSEHYYTACYDGVFMERNESASSEDLQVSDPWRVCLNLSERYQRSCAISHAQFLMQMHGFDLAKVAQVCGQVAKLTLAETCYLGYGSQIAQFAKGSLIGIRERCGLIESIDHRNVCLSSAVKEIKAQHYPDWEVVTGEICRGLPENLQQPCS